MLVVLGGFAFLSSVEVIDLANNAHASDCAIPDLPEGVYNHQAVTLNDQVVYCGGRSDTYTNR